MFSDRTHGALFIIGVIVGIVILVMVVVGSRKKSLSLIPFKIAGKADIEMSDFRFISTKDGRVEWEIRAKSAEMFEQKHQALLNDVDVKFNDNNGMDMALQGEKGILDTVSKDFQVDNEKEPIRVLMDQEYHLYTSTLEWVNKTRQIQSAAPIQLEGPNLNIRGTGLRVNLASQEIQVLHDVVAHFNR